MKKILLTLIILLSYPLVSHGADVSITALTPVVPGSIFEASIKVDTGGVAINSIEVTVSYPEDILKFEGYKDSGSIRKIWINSPKSTDKGIYFSAIIPGGVDGLYDPDKITLQAIPIVDLLFSAQNQGIANLNIIDSQILENDGLGTSFSYNIKNTSVVVTGKAVDFTPGQEPKDTVSPEALDILFVEAGFFSKTPSMVVFSSTDMDSGIDKYQILSSSGVWKDVQSPLPIPKSLFKKVITLRAVDFDGNPREGTTTIPGVFSGYQLWALIGVGVICYFVFFMVKKRR